MSDDPESAAAIAPNGKPYESVWKYPRPPRLERGPWRIEVRHGLVTVVDAPVAHRVLETSQPPAYYVHPDHVRTDLLAASTTTSFCEWKGLASYVDLTIGAVPVTDAGWRYDHPTAGFEAIAGHYAFYAQKIDSCSVDGEQVSANEGAFYGGWITTNVTGPFKGAPGTAHW